jgi:hypothetical protein
MNEIIQGISQQVGQYLPNIASAIGVLIIGWIIAHLIARVVRLAISRTGIDHQLAGWLGASPKKDMSRIIGKIVFYLAMLFVFVTFFNVLDLPVVSEPLSAFLDRIFTFAPRAISAVVLALVGWGLATVARLASRRGLEAVNIDGRLSAIGQDVSSVAEGGSALSKKAFQPNLLEPTTTDEALDLDAEPLGISEMDAEEEFVPTDANAQANTKLVDGPSSSSGDVQLSQTLPEAVYWLVLFLFLPAILGALQMPGLLEPIQGMFEKALGYLPNLLGAGIILAIGFLIAKIIRQVVTNLAASFGADHLGEKVGLMSADGGTKLSGIVGVIAYATVLFPIIVAALNTLDIEAVTNPASIVLERITAAIPGLIGGALVLAISFFIAKLVAGVVVDVLGGVGFDEFPNRLGLTKLSEAQPGTTKSTPSQHAGKAVTVVIMLLATMQALPMMGLEMLSVHLEQLIEFATQVLLGLVIIGIGVYLANLASSFVADSGVQNADRLATVAKVAIIFMAGAMGLERMGLSTSIVNVAFGTLLGGLGLAAAIAFGWGGRDAAKRLLDRYVA